MGLGGEQLDCMRVRSLLLEDVDVTEDGVWRPFEEEVVEEGVATSEVEEVEGCVMVGRINCFSDVASSSSSSGGGGGGGEES